MNPTSGHIELLKRILKDIVYDFRKISGNLDIRLIDRLSASEILADLPRVGKAFDTWLINGSELPPLPLGLNEFADTVEGIRFIRQMLGVFSKVEGSTPETDEIQQWISRQRNVGRYEHTERSKQLIQDARRFVHELLKRCPPLDEHLVCNHGPGAVAERFSPLHKWPVVARPEGLPLSQCFFNNSYLEKLETVRHPIARLCVVPKDFRGGRVISIEPSYMQFHQQAVNRLLKNALRRPFWGVSLDITDQCRNQQYALDASVDRSYATIDLKEASDWVSRRLVRSLFPDAWRSVLFSRRSHFVETKWGLTPIRSFAPMGSAQCFPVETIVFGALCWASCRRQAAYIGIPREWYSISAYGDDLVIPTVFAGGVIEDLKSVGLVPNLNKCCIQSDFRESCGWDCFRGARVDPWRLRFLPQRSYRDYSRLIASGDEALSKGLTSTARTLFDMAASIHGLLPRYNNRRAPRRWNPTYQSWQYRIPVLVPNEDVAKLDGVDGVYRWFSAKQLWSSGLPWERRNDTLAWRWVSSET